MRSDRRRVNHVFWFFRVPIRVENPITILFCYLLAALISCKPADNGLSGDNKTFEQPPGIDAATQDEIRAELRTQADDFKRRAQLLESPNEKDKIEALSLISNMAPIYQSELAEKAMKYLELGSEDLHYRVFDLLCDAPPNKKNLGKLLEIIFTASLTDTWPCALWRVCGSQIITLEFSRHSKRRYLKKTISGPAQPRKP